MRFVLIGAAFGLVLATPALSGTFVDELDVLLNDHPRLQASGAAVRGAEAGEGIAKGDFLPHLSVTGDAGYETTDSPATRAAAEAPRASSSGFQRYRAGVCT